MKLIKDYIYSLNSVTDPYQEDLWQESERPIITSDEMPTRKTDKEFIQFLLSRVEDLERRVDSLEKTKEYSNEN